MTPLQHGKWRRFGAGFAAIVAIGLLAGCAHGPQPVALGPTAPVTLMATLSVVSGGQPVALRVADERPAPDPADSTAMKKARRDFPLAGDVTTVIRERVTAGLAARGFMPAASSPDGRALAVTISRLDHAVLTGVGAGNVRATVILVARATLADGAYHESRYRSEREKQVVPTATARQVGGVVNDALSAALEKLVGDDELMEFLAR